MVKKFEYNYKFDNDKTSVLIDEEREILLDSSEFFNYVSEQFPKHMFTDIDDIQVQLTQQTLNMLAKEYILANNLL